MAARCSVLWAARHWVPLLAQISLWSYKEALYHIVEGTSEEGSSEVAERGPRRCV